MLPEPQIHTAEIEIVYDERNAATGADTMRTHAIPAEVIPDRRVHPPQHPRRRWRQLPVTDPLDGWDGLRVRAHTLKRFRFRAHVTGYIAGIATVAGAAAGIYLGRVLAVVAFAEALRASAHLIGGGS